MEGASKGCWIDISKKGALTMALFRKNPPKACPKCGRGDGWHCVLSDMPQSASANAAPVNSFSSNPVRGSIGASLTGWKGQSKRLRYRCDHCGFEKSF